jgi:PAS domain S-box-containing protein
MEATVCGCLVLLPPLQARTFPAWLEFVAGALLCVAMFFFPAVRKHRYLMMVMVVIGPCLISIPGGPARTFWAPLHVLIYALLAWVAPYLRWSEALGTALALNLVYMGGRTDWVFGTVSLSYLPTAVTDVAGKFILALMVKNWCDLHETARKTAVELAAITGSSCDLIVVLDATGTVRSVNGACRTILGYAPEEIDGQLPSLLGIPESDALGRLIQGGQPAYGIIKRARRQDGAPIWLEWNVEPLPELDALLCVGRDVTKRIEGSGPNQQE